MKYKNEFQSKEFSQALSERIKESSRGINVTLMEVCGTHTMAIHRHGILSLLPESIRLLSGPDCPVCVTPNESIDKAIEYAKTSNVILCTFGDMSRVPGTYSTLAREKANGANIQFVYSPRDALKIADMHKDKNIVFFGIGFETTAPTIGATILEAKSLNLKNFFVVSAMKVVPETLNILVNTNELKLDGFLLPGHLSVVTGTTIYEFLPAKYNLACVVAGFEPVDILQSIYMLLEQIKNKTQSVEIQYSRIVKKEGNINAQAVMKRVFSVKESTWRGIGVINSSGLFLNDDFSEFDAEIHLPVKVEKSHENPGCICGQILRGLKTPSDCPLYRKICSPESPVGACMVSSEGTCAAYYKYVAEDN